MQDLNGTTEGITIYSDSKAAISSHSSDVLDSRTVYKYRTRLNEFAAQKFESYGYQERSNIPANCRVVELARLPFDWELICLRKHYGQCYFRIRQSKMDALGQEQNSLLNLDTAVAAVNLLRLPKYTLSKSIGILTGYCIMDTSANCRFLEDLINDFCACLAHA